jgi:predicted nucleic acid-binding protein
MVVQGALRAQALTLYSEDLAHDRRFGTLSVINPFAA